MRIRAFSADSNPRTDKPLHKVSVFRAEEHLRLKTADRISLENGLWAIHYRRNHRPDHSEVRGSRERSNCLTARESQLNSEYRGPGSNFVALSREYETRLEKHILAGRKGTPRSCDVIAARVKTLLSEPEMRCVSNA